jgi:hypothetical protein
VNGFMIHRRFSHRGVLMSDRELVLHALRELVDALDRRVAHVERLGEARIAQEAIALREEAVNRIRELIAATASDRDAHDAERSGGVMTDDGGPLRKGD